MNTGPIVTSGSGTRSSAVPSVAGSELLLQFVGPSGMEVPQIVILLLTSFAGCDSVLQEICVGPGSTVSVCSGVSHGNPPVDPGLQPDASSRQPEEQTS